MNLKEYYRGIRHIIHKSHRIPPYIIWFVTSKCHAHCQHCWFWKERYLEREEMTIDEIYQASLHMPDIYFMMLTGGDPFLRDDLPEIAYIFYKNSKVRRLDIPSNGMYTHKIKKDTEEILKRCPNLFLTVDISLDGIYENHDRIRGVEGLFEKAIDSYWILQDLRNRYKRLDTGITTTVSNFNQTELEEIYRFVKNELKTEIWMPTLIRGKPRNPIAKNIDISYYEKANKMMEKDIEKGFYKGYKGFALSSFISAKNALRRKIIVKTYKEKRAQLHCYAGVLSGVVFDNGDVHPCELLNEKFGNLRNVNYDLGILWTSQKAKEIREKIKVIGCFCTHECFLTTSIPANFKFLLPLFREWWRFKA